MNRTPKYLLIVITLAFLGQLPFYASPTETSSPLTNSILFQPLSLADSINIALRQNPNILRAQKDVAAAEGVAIQTRALAIPKVRSTGHYTAIAQSDVDKPNLSNSIPGFTFGTDQSWGTDIRLVQSIYEGGRVTSSLRAARLTRERAVLDYQTVVADTVLDVETTYEDVLLARAQIAVQEASVQLLEQELADTTRRFDAGTVPRFNVLRAEVELANARPRLIRARNAYRIFKNNLANQLGFNIPRETLEDIPMQLTGNLEAVPYDLDLTRAIALGLERRTELASLRSAQALRKEDLINARAGYKPSIQAFGGYDARTSVFDPVLTHEIHGWIAGVQMTWDIFDGLRTQGKIKEATALSERSQVDLDDAARRIELEVRTAFSNFINAKEVLESQKKVLEQAEEALRLATARNQAGTSTQLDVLSAQTALTEARTTQSLALREYAVARAKLERAVGGNVE